MQITETSSTIFSEWYTVSSHDVDTKHMPSPSAMDDAGDISDREMELELAVIGSVNCQELSRAASDGG